jgi:hypothetical protein
MTNYDHMTKLWSIYDLITTNDDQLVTKLYPIVMKYGQIMTKSWKIKTKSW